MEVVEGRMKVCTDPQFRTVTDMNVLSLPAHEPAFIRRPKNRWKTLDPGFDLRPEAPKPHSPQLTTSQEGPEQGTMGASEVCQQK
ncbi:hypothetical protein FQA47_017889 [Oryzias melastigma]|uniref:Uncharacterized protein n=1 Tax=Oryzias melastigma TaxID=30732 RepID=A0A834CI70_ORYME|nr:hypothetical protein FQA47_017889 [Oryzias melastigma]